MAQTTVTTIVLVVAGLGLLTMASWAWFGSWQPVVRRVRVASEDDIEAAVAQMRRSIAEYERRRAP